MPYKNKVLQEMFHRVFEWVMAYRAALIIFGGIGTRRRTTGSTKFKGHHYGPKFVLSNDDSCGQAALANGLSEPRGITEGIGVDRHLWKHPMKTKTLKELFHLVHQVLALLCMQVRNPRRIPKKIFSSGSHNEIMACGLLE